MLDISFQTGRASGTDYIPAFCLCVAVVLIVCAVSRCDYNELV